MAHSFIIDFTSERNIDRATTWHEFVLDPQKLDKHVHASHSRLLILQLDGLKDGSIINPNGIELIKIFLKQADVLTTGVKKEPEIAQKCLNFAAKISISLGYSVSDLESNIPFKYQKSLFVVTDRIWKSIISKMNFYRWVIREATKAIPVAFPDGILQNFGKPSQEILFKIVNPIDSPLPEVIDESDVVVAVQLISVWITIMEELLKKGNKSFDSPDFKMLYEKCDLDEGDYIDYVYQTAFDLLQFMFHRQSFKESSTVLPIADYFATTLVKQHNRSEQLVNKMQGFQVALNSVMGDKSPPPIVAVHTAINFLNKEQDGEQILRILYQDTVNHIQSTLSGTTTDKQLPRVFRQNLNSLQIFSDNNNTSAIMFILRCKIRILNIIHSLVTSILLNSHDENSNTTNSMFYLEQVLKMNEVLLESDTCDVLGSQQNPSTVTLFQYFLEMSTQLLRLMESANGTKRSLHGNALSILDSFIRGVTLSPHPRSQTLWKLYQQSSIHKQVQNENNALGAYSKLDHLESTQTFLLSKRTLPYEAYSQYWRGNEVQHVAKKHKADGPAIQVDEESVAQRKIFNLYQKIAASAKDPIISLNNDRADYSALLKVENSITISYYNLFQLIQHNLASKTPAPTDYEKTTSILTSLLQKFQTPPPFMILEGILGFLFSNAGLRKFIPEYGQALTKLYNSPSITSKESFECLNLLQFVLSCNELMELCTNYMNLETQGGNSNTANIQTQKQLGKQIDPAFVKLLEYLLKTKTEPVSEQTDSNQIAHVEWNLKSGILMYLYNKDGEWILDVFLQLLSGALYHIRKAKKSSSWGETSLDRYGPIAQLAGGTSFFVVPVANPTSTAPAPSHKWVNPQNEVKLLNLFKVTLDKLVRLNDANAKYYYALADYYYNIQMMPIGETHTDGTTAPAVPKDIMIERSIGAIRNYLLGGSIETAFFTKSAVGVGSLKLSKRFYTVVKRLISALSTARAFLQAAVLCQFLPNVDYGLAFKLIQDNYQQLDTFYFSFVWEIPILEIAIAMYSKQKDEKHVSMLTWLISRPELNQFNPQPSREVFIDHLKLNFLKALATEFLL